MRQEIKNYNNACEDIVKLFVKTYFDGLDYDFVNNEYDGIVEVAGCYFDFATIKIYIEVDASESDFIESYDFFINLYLNGETPKINLTNWLKYPELRK